MYMPSPWDYRSDQRQGVNWERKYYIVLADETGQPLYEYVRMVGKIYSKIKSSRKAHFAPLDKKNERIYFIQYSDARNAIVTIAKATAANVPVGRYLLMVTQTFENEPVVSLPYYVEREIKDDTSD